MRHRGDNKISSRESSPNNNTTSTTSNTISSSLINNQVMSTSPKRDTNNSLLTSTTTSSSNFFLFSTISEFLTNIRLSRYIRNMNFTSYIILCFILAFTLAIMVKASSSSSTFSTSSNNIRPLHSNGGIMSKRMHNDNNMAVPEMMMASAAMAPAPPVAVDTPMFDEERGGGGGNMGMRSKMASSNTFGGNNNGGDGIIQNNFANTIDAMQNVPLNEDKTMLKGNIILRSGSTSMETFFITTIIEKIQNDILDKIQGYMESSSTSTNEWIVRQWNQINPNKLLPNQPTNAYLQLRIPNKEFTNVQKQLHELPDCTITSESTQGVDVTESYVDVVTRQKVDEKAFAQMEILLKQTTTIHETLQVKREMDMINSRLESLKAQRKQLESRATMSSLSININVPNPPQPSPSPIPTPPSWSIGTTFTKAIGSLGQSIQFIIEIVIYTLVFVVPIIVISTIGYGIYRRCSNSNTINTTSTTPSSSSTGYNLMR